MMIYVITMINASTEFILSPSTSLRVNSVEGLSDQVTHRNGAPVAERSRSARGGLFIPNTTQGEPVELGVGVLWVDAARIQAQGVRTRRAILL